METMTSGTRYQIRQRAALVAVISTLSVTAASGAELAEGQHHYYNAHYSQAADIAASLIAAERGNLAAYELRTAALHFQLRDALGEAKDKERALKACMPCAPLLKIFLDEISTGQKIARERLAVNPQDEEAQFFLGKIDLNYIWLQLDTLGRRTGWKEFWEARRSLDAVLKRNPDHTRAHTARAWIDYIVATRPPRGTRWMLGGGNRKRALAEARAAAAADSERFVRVEAEFALWEMLVRERNVAEAKAIARKLAAEFPENRKLIRFLQTQP